MKGYVTVPLSVTWLVGLVLKGCPLSVSAAWGGDGGPVLPGGSWVSARLWEAFLRFSLFLARAVHLEDPDVVTVKKSFSFSPFSF